MVELDLRNISVTSMELHMEHIENELSGKVNFNANKFLRNEVMDIIDSGKGCNITYRVNRTHDENTVEEIVTRDCFITGFQIKDLLLDRDENFDWKYDVTLDFITANAGIRILSVLKSKDGKEIVVAPEVAKLVNKNCNPKDITFDNLQKVVLACEI